MSDTCVKHSFETAVGVCRQCRNSYCSECLVYAFGENKPPYCVTCALNVAGVRHQGAKPNPRLRKRGLFGRKKLVEDEPRAEKTFDDFKIVLPEEAASAPVMTETTRREVSPEVLAMVQSAEADGRYDTAGDYEAGAVAVTTAPPDANDSLADWAASLDPTDAPTGGDPAEAWPDSSGSSTAWPEDSIGRSY